MIGRKRGGEAAESTVDLVETAPRRSQSRWWWILVAVFVAGCVTLVVVYANQDPKTKTIKLTGNAATFRLGDVRTGRREVDLEAFRGKPVVLNFFGSWCTPCQRELPDFQAVSKRYRKVAFVGVTYNDTRPGARKMLSGSGVTYPAAFDPHNEVALDYAIRAMPTTVFISPSGRLIERAERALTEPQLDTILRRLFPEQT
jgi:thiol-disulfide isomerase/thioredoxin